MKCIYCEQDNPDKLKSKEHVILKLMGVFVDDNNNLTLVNHVCKFCNEKIFNPLETKFKEDTEEGIFYQMFNLSESSQFRIKNDMTKTSFNPGFKDAILKGVFPFFDLNSDNLKMKFVPQIRINKKGDTFWILLIEKMLDLIKNSPSKFEKILSNI